MSSTIDITTRHHLIVEGASVCRLIALNRHRDRCRYAERPRLTGAEASWPRGKITSSRVYAAVSYELDHQYHDHTPPDGRDGVSLSRECSTSIPLRLSVTTCASSAQRRRGSLTTTKSLACLMIVPPRGQGDGYITAWYQVSIKTLKLPRHGRFNARRSSDARSSLAPLSRVADEGAGRSTHGPLLHAHVRPECVLFSFGW